MVNYKTAVLDIIHWNWTHSYSVKWTQSSSLEATRSRNEERWLQTWSCNDNQLWLNNGEGEQREILGEVVADREYENWKEEKKEWSSVWSRFFAWKMCEKFRFLRKIHDREYKVFYSILSVWSWSCQGDQVFTFGLREQLCLLSILCVPLCAGSPL